MFNIFGGIFLLSLLGLIPFFLGVLLQQEKFCRKYIKWSNEIRGTKTEITQNTIKWTKVSGIFLILIGLFFGLILLFGAILPQVFP